MSDKFNDPFSSTKKEAHPPKTKEGISSEENIPDFIEIREKEEDAEERIAAIDIDKVPLDQQDEFYEAITELSDLPFFEGEVKHFYAYEYTQQIHQCPRCGGLLQQQYANWIYAIMSGGQRIMLTPAGYFCLKCPTVIVDENLIKQGITGNYKYREFLSIQYENNQISGMETLNGKKAIALIRDEEMGDMSWVTADDIPPEYGRSSTKKTPSNRKSSQRKRMQKNSKKQQRAKKKKKKKRKRK